MGIKTDIEWADSTVNPTVKCDGCELWNTKSDDPAKQVRKCYAGRMTERWKGAGSFDGPIEIKPGRMAETLKWLDLTGKERKNKAGETIKPWLSGMPRVIFVGDMADVFSHSVKFQYLKEEIVDVAARSPHIYMMLTKQARRMNEFAYWLIEKGIRIPHNLWFGVSVTSQATRARLNDLWAIRALFDVAQSRPRFFVSYEPVLEDVDFEPYVHCFDLLMLGGESGPGAATLELSTVRNTLQWCRRRHVSPFVKQMGTAWARAHGAVSFKGGDMSEWPSGVRVREMPKL